MCVKEDYLIILNCRNRILKIRLTLCFHPIRKIYTIFRVRGLFDGKEMDDPVIEITNGSQGRNILEQAMMMYRSFLKKYLDKGYVKLSSFTSKHYNDCTEQEMIEFLNGNFISDQHGVPKPMLAKSLSLCSSDVLNKDLFVSRKLDGVRMLVYCKDGLIQTASRGGNDYNISANHIRQNEVLKLIFQRYPNIIFDGELYKHGWPLQKISGLARLKERTEECDELEYWIYDIVDEKMPFTKRYEILEQLRDLFDETSKIKILEQKKMNGYISIKREHDKYVLEGFEGLCARNPDKGYGINKRSSIYLIKMKDYQDDEFEIVGVKEGLRPEDMCFVLKTADKKEFCAKPIGDAKTRIYYLEHSEEFIGKKATCKYFNLSKDGIPTQPIFKSIREEGE